MKYRKEITGLRALAILSVILFHTGFTTFSGGFVGVDIFFVISGYLITTIIVDEMDQGSFSLLNFYERRARRILPALFFVMLCILPFAWYWMLPQDLQSFSQSLVAVVLFASNVFFWLTNGYFDSISELKPLLNTWSLAVEEQYYFLFPVFLMLAWKLGKKWIISLLIIVTIISVIAAQYGSTNHSSFTFYLLPTRVFEILIGVLISLYINHKQNIISVSQSVSQSVSLAGFVLVLYAIFSFDKNTPFPSLYTLIPTIGVGLILVYSNNNNFVGKLLGSQLFVSIGLISYSVYLWYQPLFAFARLRSINEPSIFILGLLAILSFALGYLSWKFIETPFRNKNSICRKKIFFYSALSSIFFIAIGLIGHINKGFESRLIEQDKAILKWQSYDFTQTLRRYQCFLDPESTYLEFKNECFGEHTADAYLIWGDSYAAASSKGIRALHNDVIQLTASGCPPLIDKTFTKRPNCLKINEFIIGKIKELKPKKIFLQANWHDYKKENVVENLHTTIEFITRESPLTKIVILGSVPKWNPTLPLALIKRQLNINQIDYVYMPLYSELKKIDLELITLANKKKINYISILDNFCIENLCLAVTEYKSTFWLTTWDDGHLTEAGSIYLFTKLKNIINN